VKRKNISPEGKGKGGGAQNGPPPISQTKSFEGRKGEAFWAKRQEGRD